jgi:uncharacterized membrane protein
LIKQRQAIGILGMVFAIGGGIGWFLQQILLAIMLWGFAGLILLKLNKQKKRIRSRK